MPRNLNLVNLKQFLLNSEAYHHSLLVDSIQIFFNVIILNFVVFRSLFFLDEHFRTTPPEQNIPVTLALIGIWYTNFFDAHSEAILPYDQGLSRFPAYLQQGDMESNGKSVDRNGKPVKYSCPVVFGSSGSNAQHSYFQLLHQGKEVIPIDFIAIREPMSNLPEAVEHHRILLSNCLAQAQALANGKQTDNPNNTYPGKRPSNLLILPKLNAFYLGALLALYENRATTLGALWNINSFDQPGVELGKVLAKPIEAALKNASPVNADSHIDAITAQRINLFNPK